jgi:hypothetical protein
LKKQPFEPDYHHILQVLYNRKSERLPLYEHHIDTPFIVKALDRDIGPQGDKPADLENHYREITGFWKDMSYDAFDYEAAICEIFPGHGAIMGGMAGPVQTMADLEKYPFGDLPRIFWQTYKPHLEAIRKVMPRGMKAFGGCGYGIFESAEDLVGYQYLATMQYTDPDLFALLFKKIGDLYVTLWTEMTRSYSDLFVFFRMGDDLGYKTATLLEPDTIRKHILPQYKRVIDIVHASGKKFLLHSCGNIFEVMEDIIALGIDAKHSNEDEIAPFERWIEMYNHRIGLFGGIDVNILCLNKPDEVFRIVLDRGMRYRSMAGGYGIGSGNSIAGYVPVDNYLAMVEAVQELRRQEK